MIVGLSLGSNTMGRVSYRRGTDPSERLIIFAGMINHKKNKILLRQKI
jgi:hypothetical protein